MSTPGLTFGASGTPGPAPAPGGFTFGSSTPAAGHPAAAPTQFSFGTTPAAGAPATPAPPAGAFSLNPTPAPAAGATSTPAATAPPTFGSTANAPAAPAGAPTPSFAFGSTAANTPAPGSFSAPAPPAAAGAPAPFSLGASAPTTTPAPATGGFPAFGATSTTPAPAGGGVFGSTLSTTTAPAAPRGMEVPDFRTEFPNEGIFQEIRRLLAKSAKPSDEGQEAALEIGDRLKCDGSNPKAIGKHLVAPKPLAYKGPDNNLRHQLQTNPTVVLPGHLEATLLPEMQRQVFRIADDLRVSERDALVLFAEVRKQGNIAALEEKLVESIIDKSFAEDDQEPLPPVAFGTNVVKAAEELYFFERQRCLQTTLLLAQSRIEAPHKAWGALIIQATDTLLQNGLIFNLIQLVREWTVIIGGIQESLARDQSQSFSAITKDKKKKKHFDMVHLRFAKQERQTAVDALFYLSYQTQFEVTEVAHLIDLVKDLTNGVNGHKGLPLLDPFRDVPSAYEDHPQIEQPWAPFQNNPPPQKERKHLEWEGLLVKKTRQTNLPELLRCVSSLVMTVICTMDTKQVLIDRTTHRENVFGKGNKLCPPGESSMRGLEPIEARLKPEGVRDWLRTDICGLFCGAYAMLRSANVQLMGSPRAGGSSPSKVLARTVGDLLTAPMALKSIAFARLCLLPALQRPSLQPESLCDSSEFLVSVLSDFVAGFIDVLSHSGNLPGSRAAWKKEQEEGLELQREQQKQQREFRLWSGNIQGGQGEAPVPSSVDLMHRPDCMDDIITLAVAVASLGPEFAIKFWSTSQTPDKGPSLVPSKTLRKLKAIIAEDESLAAYYYAFLAALSTASFPSALQSASDVVNSMLKPTESRWDWDHVLNTLRWYYRQFDRSRASTTTTNTTNMSSAQSTTYYYRNVSVDSSQEASKSLTKSQPLPLGQTNTFWVLSMLGLVENATKSPSARLAILSKQLPIRAENSGTVLGNDTTLNILFALLTAPITPEIRGAITTTISSLISMEGMENAKEEDKAKMREFSLNAWELVESCGVLPIMLLDQHPPMTGEVNRTHGLQFPASSTSLAGSGGTNNAMIPVDKSYAILFEMEHVESHSGCYPSTEGFLRLLNALFSCSCPSTLGQRGWTRLRLGCTPYIEYVVHYVLPRATGSVSSMGKLPFRSKADQARLVALALQVIESVLVRYSFSLPLHPAQRTLSLAPSHQQVNSPTYTEAFDILGHKALAEKVVNALSASSTGGGQDDFENKTLAYGQQFGQTSPGFAGMQTQAISQSFRGPTASNTPAPKSPGFVVLANILSAADAELLLSVARVLADSTTLSSSVGNETSNLAEAYALFKEEPPTLSSAKHAGRKDTISSSMRENQLEGLRPGFSQSSLSYSASVSWQERSVIHALRILCAAAAREEKFYAAVNSSLQPLRIVPTVRFDKRPGLAAQINVQNVHLARLSDLLLASNDLMLSVVDYVGQDGSTEEHDVAIAMSALSMMYFVYQRLPAATKIEAVFGRNNLKRLSSAMARRLSVAFNRSGSPPDSQILHLILEWMLADLRSGKKGGLAHALFAAPEGSAKHRWNAHNRTMDCFGALLEMLNDHSFITERETSGFAASCFEIFGRFCDLKDVDDQESLRQVVYAMERLRASFFWQHKLKFFLQSPGWDGPSNLQAAVASENPNWIHALAFFLKGVASELHMLSGFAPPAGEPSMLVGYIAPRLGERNDLLSALFGDDGISNIIKDLPIDRLSVDNSARMPPQDVIRSAMKDLHGSYDVVSGYKVVDENLLMKKASQLYGNAAQVEEFQRWSSSWNMAIKMDCAATHLSDVLRTLVLACLYGYDSATAMPSEMLAVVLTTILDRLVGVSGGASQLSPTATHNLSLIASVLTQQVVFPESGSSMPVNDLRRIRDLLARAVVASGQHPNGPDASRHQERTAILSASLVEVMQAIPGTETEIDNNLFLRAAHTLARLSSVVEQGPQNQSGVKPTEAASIARTNLSLLVQIWDQDIDSPNQSLAFTLLSQAPDGESKTNAEVILGLVSSLDDDIVTLVEELLHVPFVGDALLQSGLMKAMTNAADVYLKEEQRLQQSWAQGVNGQKVALGFPSCLLKFLEVFRVLMATTHRLSDVHVRELPLNFSLLLDKFRPVVERAFANFASHGEELRVLVQCVAQAFTLQSDTTQSAVHAVVSPFQPVNPSRSSFRGSAIESAVQFLCLHLAENPLPRDFLADLPYSLASSENTVTSNVVPVSRAMGSSWWESFHVKRRSLACNFEEFSEEMFCHAILGAEILKAGLVVLTKNLPPKSLDVEISFVRALFVLSRTAQAVETQVEALAGASSLAFMETDAAKMPSSKRLHFLRKYGRLLSNCLHRLLIVLLSRVNMFFQEPENRLSDSVGKYAKALGDTLAYTELETQGIPCSVGKEEEERGKLLALALRRHMQGGSQVMYK